MQNIIIATIKSWNIKNAQKLQETYKGRYQIKIIEEALSYDFVKECNPRYIFFPHWSWIIQKEVLDNFNCVVFHMTDLPFGRGGSPLQNLIARGIRETQISAIKVTEVLDGGPVYLKKALSLYGTAEEILMRASEIEFFEMIPHILEKNPEPIPQQGKAEAFKRRKPEDGEILPHFDKNTIYDTIRMLDGEGYPNAFIRFGKYKITFSRASIKSDKIIADVAIMEET